MSDGVIVFVCVGVSVEVDVCVGVFVGVSVGVSVVVLVDSGVCVLVTIAVRVCSKAICIWASDGPQEVRRVVRVSAIVMTNSFS